MITSNDETKKKKDLALKASPLENNDDDFEDGEVALLSSWKLLQTIHYLNGRSYKSSCSNFTMVMNYIVSLYI